MSPRFGLPVLVGALVACGTAPSSGGGLQVNVTYTLLGGSAGCIRVRAVPDTGTFVDQDVSLQGRPRTGTVRVAINRSAEWTQPGVTILCSLHADRCDGVDLASKTVDSSFPTAAVEQIDVTLTQSAGDGGAGGGAGSGGGAGGGAGGSAGGSAGGVTGACDGGFVRLRTPFAADVRDIALLPGNRAWIGGTNAPHVALRDPTVGDGGFAPPTGGCGDDVTALWAAPAGHVFVAGGFSSIDRLANTASACMQGPPIQNSRATSMIGFAVGGGHEVIVGHEDGRISHRGVDGLSLSFTQDMGDDVWAIDGLSANTLYAAGGAGSNGRGALFKRVPDAGWVEDLALNAANSRFFAISVASPTLAYAAGEPATLYRTTGGAWVADMPTPFTIRSLKVFSSTSIYAVGDSPTVQRWDGSTWAQVANFAGVNALHEIRGDSECNLWVVGAAGLVATTRQR